jgi:hypothetical protein
MPFHIPSSTATRITVTLATTLALTLAIATSADAVTNTYCNSGTTTVWSGNGLWSDQSGWSNGLPTDNCDAVIQSGTLTFTTLSDHYGNEDTAAAYGMTIDSGATLVIEGEASDVQGNWYNATTLTIGADGLTIQSGATLDLEATGNSAQTPVSGEAPGGVATLNTDGSNGKGITNAGTINASTSDSDYGEGLQWNGTLANTGTINVSSGKLTVQGANYPMILDNTGTVNVAPSATYYMLAGDGSSLVNTGTFANQGTADLYTAGSMYWGQNGGTETGSPVELTGGMGFEDSSGAGSFEYTSCAGGFLSGTIPTGQTVSVLGGCSGTTLTLGTRSGDSTVANHGTLILDAPAGASDAILAGGQLQNYGALESTVGGPSPLANQLLVPLVNEAGGTVTLTGGELAQTTGSATSNAGTVSIAPGAVWLVQGGSFTNSGAIATEIGSRTDLGQFNLTASSKFNAGGTLAPELASGYTPASGAEFPVVLYNGGTVSGTFKSVTNGFSADYTKEALSSNAYVGLIYGGSATRPAVAKISGGAGQLTVKLSCAKTAKSCAAYTLLGTSDKKTVAGGHHTIKPGKTLTVTLKLNATGMRLLRQHGRLRVKLKISAGGKTLKVSTVTVTHAKAKKR